MTINLNPKLNFKIQNGTKSIETVRNNRQQQQSEFEETKKKVNVTMIEWYINV